MSVPAQVDSLQLAAFVVHIIAYDESAETIAAYVVSVVQHVASAAHSGPGEAHASAPLPDELPLPLLLELLLELPPSVVPPRQADSHDVQERRHVSHDPVQELMAEQFWMQDAHELPRAIAAVTACAEVH